MDSYNYNFLSNACYTRRAFYGRKISLPPYVLHSIEERYKLNDPLYKQYGDYLCNLVQGDLGPSFKYPGRSVNDIIKDGFPVSFKLGIEAILIAIIIGIPAEY